MKEAERIEHAKIPMKWVGPVKLVGNEVVDDIMLPLATYESPLWPSVNRGARVSVKAGGLHTVVVDERMSRSILLQAPDAAAAVGFMRDIMQKKDEVAAIAEQTSRFARFKDMHAQVVADLVYLRIEMSTGDASGHNMITAAADQVMSWVLTSYPGLTYVSVSGNYCTDKKVSAVNGILGRGRHVIAEATIPRKICTRYLKSTPEAMVDLNIKKNLLGTMIAGGLRSANAHFANMLLAFYLATGQDAANIVEGSQGVVHAEVRNDDLYFSVTIPHLIVGTVGNGKELDFVRENLKAMGCLEDRKPGMNARRLAVIAASAVWCGELSLMAALTNPGELMQAHISIERK